MLSVGEIATRDGVSKPAVSRKVKQLVEKHGLTVERDERGRVSRVNVAQYDHLRQRTDDPSKAQAPKLAPDLPNPNQSYDEALRQKTWIEAERARLRLEEERGELVRVAKFAEAATVCGQEIARIEQRLVNRADEHCAIALKEGPHGLRSAYRAWVEEQCTAFADAMARLAALERERQSKPASDDASAEEALPLSA
jgi:DNA-binding transcriptional ArsR family regulator